MSLQIIDVGSIANDNTGEPLRDAFVKVNENFSELYTQTLGTGANLIIVGNSLEATNTNGNVELVPNGSGIIKLGNVVVDGPQIRCSPIGVLTLDTATSVNSLTVTGGFNVGGASNLGAVANVTITGGSVGYALTTDGSGTLSWSSAALITGATGAANRLAYFATTGSNISDTGANLTWNGANLLTVNGNISTGNVIAGNLTVGADKIVSANTIITIDPSSSGPGGTVIIEGNLQVTGTTTTVNSTTVEVADLNITLAKDAATAAAANGAGLTVAGASATITYASTGDKWTFNKPIDVTGSIVGSSTLNITGNANVANLGTAGLITATGNITGGNLVTGGALSVTGNATVGNISATNANVTAITATGNANVGNLGTAGLITATGNVTGGNLKTGGILSVTGNATVGNISATNANVTAITATGNANVGNLGAAAGVFTGNITAGNINSVSGILSVTGNANLGNLGAGAGVFTGVVTVTGNLSGGNISTLGVLNVTGNANVGNIGATAAVLAGPLSGVTTINASGNANVGNIGSQHSIHTGNGSFGNINSVSGILSVTGNANVGNIGAGAAVLAGPLSGVTTINASGNANVGNIGATNSVVTANATFGNINSVSGILSVTGNANVGNIGATAAVLAGPLSGVTTINASGNANVGNIGATRGVFTSIVGNLETTAQSNITVVGTLTGLTVSGNLNAQANVFVTSNITAGNINSVSGILSVTGNANVGNIGAGAAVLAGPLSGVTTISASGNANVGNLGAAAGVFTSNVSAGNISTTGVLSVTGNANVGNLGVAGLITATGNITGANITSNGNISTSNLAVTNLSNLGNVGNVRITGGSTDYVLRTDGAGNLSWVAAGLISGNVNVGTSTRLAYYATSGQSISDTGANLTWNGSNLLTVTGNISAGNLAGTITTAAQPNITSVGSLSSLTVTGNLSAGNISTTGVLSVTGNANVGNLGATNIVGTLATNAQPNITSVGNLVALNAGLTNITASTDSTSTTSGALVVAGGVGIGGNLNVGAANRAHVITGNVTITGNITVTGNQNIIGSNNISYTDNILELHNQANSAPWTTDDGKDVGIRVHYYKGADKHAFFGWSNDAQSLEYYYDGTESGGVFSGSYGTFKGNVFHSTATTGTAPFTINSTTQVANLHAALAGSVTGNAQGNITSVGTLTSLNVSGNANLASSTGTVIVGAGGDGSNSVLNVRGNLSVGAANAQQYLRLYTGNFAGQYFAIQFGIDGFYGGNEIRGSAVDNYLSFWTNTTERIRINSNGNVGIGNTAPTHTLRIEGTFSATGNANVGNLGTAGLIIATGNVSGGNLTTSGLLSVTGNANVGNIGATRGVFTNIAGTLETASQTNITAVGTLSSLTVSGNITGQSNVLVTSNITAGNINSVSGILSVTGNANVGNIGSNNAVFTGTLSVTGNSTQGNITTGNTITYGQFGTPIKLRVLSDNSLSFDGSSGQLFSITDTLTGDIFSVNDITGLPSIRVDSNATVYLAEISGNVGIGNVAPAHKLSVTGTMNVSGNANVGNLGAAAGVFTGNITAGNINSVSGILSVTGNANVGNIGATRGVFTNISGTIESGSASQTNITAVGTLSSLTVSGNAFLATSSGNVGIGTVTPNSQLHVVGSQRIQNSAGSAFLDLYTSSTLRGQIYIDVTTNGLLFNSQTNPILFYANGERARFVATTGNFLLGTTTDDAVNTLQVNGAASIRNYSGTATFNMLANPASQNSIIFNDGASGVGTQRGYIYYYSSSNSTYPNVMAFGTASSERMRITAAGNFLIGTTTDDGSNKLQVSGTLKVASASGGVIKTEDTSAGTTTSKIETGAGYTTTGTVTNHPFILASNNTEAIRIFGTTQNVNIGPSVSDAGFKLNLSASGSSGTARFYDATAVSGSTKVVVRAGAGQSGNLQEWQNNAGTALMFLRAADGLLGATILSTADIQTAALSNSGSGYTAGLNLKSAGGIGWSSTGNWFDTKDLGLARNAAGVLEINNGTAGTYRDLILRGLTATNTAGTAKLVWDSANERLGVGTASPTYALDVQATSNTVGVRALSNTAGDILYYATGTVTGDLNVFRAVPNATGLVNHVITNANTSTGGAVTQVSVPSTSTGDPFLQITVSGAVDFTLGLDNSASDIFKMGFMSSPSGSGEALAISSTTRDVMIGTLTDSGYKLEVANSGSSGTARFYDATAVSGSTLVAVRAGAGQSGNLQEWQSSAGTVLAYVSSIGAIRTANFMSLNDGIYLMDDGNSHTVQSSTWKIKWTNGSAGSTPDLGLARNAAGVLEINNGTAGTYRDLITRKLSAISDSANTVTENLIIDNVNNSATPGVSIVMKTIGQPLATIVNHYTYGSWFLHFRTASSWGAAPTSKYTIGSNNIGGGTINTVHAWYKGDDTEAMRLTHGGNFVVGGTTDGNFRLDVASSGSSGTARFYDQTATNGSTTVQIRAGEGQSTTSLFSLLANNGNNLVQIYSNSGYGTLSFYNSANTLIATVANKAGTTLNFYTQYAGVYQFTGGQSAQHSTIWLETSEGKLSGIRQWDVAHANGRLFELVSGPGVPIRISPADTEAVRITTSGNVGIGNTAPTHTLRVEGTFSASGNANVGNIGATNAVITGNMSLGNLIAGNLTLGSDALTSSNSTITIDPSTAGTGGNVIIQGNLQVTGTTTTINSTTMDVTDLNITVAKGAANPAAANGAGLTIDGAAATLTYNSTSNIWVFDRALSVSGNANVSNIGATNSVITANGTFGNINSVSGILSVTGNANVGNIGATRGVFTNISGTIESGSASQTNITAVGTLTSLTVSGNITGQSNVLVTSNITAGNINSVSGILSVTGNANVGNIGATRGVFTNISGTIESGSASQTNITAVGTLGSLTVSGNAFLSTSSGNVGVGTSTPAYKLEVNGSFAATTKSFVIDHPTQTGMKLRYGSLEGPENGVYVRGRSSSHVIDLPEYWSKLVDPASITVNITPIGQSQNIVVMAYDNQQVTLAGVEAEYFYTVNAERIDVEKLTVEFEA